MKAPRNPDPLKSLLNLVARLGEQTCDNLQRLHFCDDKPPDKYGSATAIAVPPVRYPRGPQRLESQAGPFPVACHVPSCDSTSPIREAVAWP